MPDPAPRRGAINRVLRDAELQAAWRWFVLSGAIGGVAGVGAIAFYYVSAALSEICLVWVCGYEAGGPAREPQVFHVGEPLFGAGLFLAGLVIVPAVGNFIAGLLAWWLAPDARGHGTDAAIDAYHRKRGEIGPKTTIVKLFASAITLGTGGSGGREGPIAQIGAGFGSWLGRVLNLSAMDRRILLAAGLAAGIGAIFRAPLAAALFASEILYRQTEFEAEVLMPAMMSSIAAYCVFSVVTGDFSALFVVADHSVFHFTNPFDLLPYAILALVVTLVGVLYVKVFYGVEAFVERTRRVPALLWPLIGGALAGSVALGLYVLAGQLDFDGSGNVSHAVLSVLGFGYGLLQGLLDPAWAASRGLVSLESHADVMIALLLMVVFGKILTTSFTISSGGSAGVFGPSMVIGGALGGAVGCFFQAHGHADSAAPFVILGMAGMFAGVAKTPVSTVIMVCELTAGYELLMPAMWVCTISYLLLGRKAALYRAQPDSRADSLAHRGDFLVDVFKGMKVGDLIPHRLDTAHPVNANLTLSQVVPEVIRTNDTYFPVVDKEGVLRGIFSLNDLREFLYDEALGDLCTAMDVATTRVVKLRLSDPLNEALARFTMKGFEVLPVVEDGDDEKPRLVGMLGRRAVLAEYTDRLHTLKQSAEGVSELIRRNARSSRRQLVARDRHPGRAGQSHGD